MLPEDLDISGCEEALHDFQQSQKTARGVPVQNDSALSETAFSAFKSQSSEIQNSQ